MAITIRRVAAMIKLLIKTSAYGFAVAAIFAQGALALDYPHCDVNNIDCISCHDPFTPGETGKYLLYVGNSENPVGSGIEATEANNLCVSCHNDFIAPLANPHSSLRTGNKYGAWAMECIDCHNPHWQGQFSLELENLIATGKIDQITELTITDNNANGGNGWTDHEFKEMIVFTRYEDIENGALSSTRSYRIADNDKNVLYIEPGEPETPGGPGKGIDLDLAVKDDSFAIAYGKSIRFDIDVPNNDGFRDVKFFRPEGINSFADGDAVYDGICEVCHTKTAYHRNNDEAPAPDDYWINDFPSKPNHSHNAGADCTNCHMHVNGFVGMGAGGHKTHVIAESGPEILCSSGNFACHGTVDVLSFDNGVVSFYDDSGAPFDLGATQICNNCHTSDGAATAKNYWNNPGGWLSVEGEKSFCGSCHGGALSNTPSNTEMHGGGADAPDVLGDDINFGFYVTGHGKPSGEHYLKLAYQGSGETGNPGAGQTCSNCHDTQAKHFAGEEQRLKQGFAVDQENSNCNQCHVQGGIATNAPDLYSYSMEYEEGAHRNLLCAKCHEVHGRYDAGGGFASTGAGMINNTDVRALCLYCHNAAPPDLSPLPAPPLPSSNIVDHASTETTACSKCHNPHKPAHGADSTGVGCIECHGHDADAAYDPDMSMPYVPGSLLSQGKGSAQSHSTHTEISGDDLKGPGIYCDTCHDVDKLPYFKSGDVIADDGKYDLAETDVCDNCHSPGGLYDGVSDPEIGAKFNWKNGIYVGAELAVGKEKWCAGCHDDDPAYSKADIADSLGIHAPNKVGDEIEGGYYLTGHGNDGVYNATRHGQNGPNYSCTVCHNAAASHINHFLGETRLKNISPDGLDYTTSSSEFCLDCHRPGQSGNGELGYDSSAEATVHSGGGTGNYNTNAATVFPAYGNAADYAASPGYQCNDCHNVHGTTKLAMVLETIDGKIGGSNPLPLQGFEATDSDLTDLDPDNASDNGVCDLCHEGSFAPHPDTDHSDNHNQGNNGYSCVRCHPHDASFQHGSDDCKACHGHEAGTAYDPDMSAPYEPGASLSQGKGTTQSHSTHTEIDVDDLKGPGIYCDTCHDINNLPYFKSGDVITDDGKYDLEETDVCDNCHSPGGYYNGVDNPVVGAKNNWHDGVYAGNVLAEGKERWCVGCHDDVPANSKADGSGVSARNVLGDYPTWGYYQTGHGKNESIDCLLCHSSRMKHIDHLYAPLPILYDVNWPQGLTPNPTNYRFYSGKGLTLPLFSNTGTAPSSAYSLCYSCHDEYDLKSMERTNYRQDGKAIYNPANGDGHQNLHDTHIGIYPCVMCHDPHGTTAPRMTVNSRTSNYRVITSTSSNTYDLLLDPLLWDSPAYNAGGATTLRTGASCSVGCHDYWSAAAWEPVFPVTGNDFGWYTRTFIDVTGFFKVQADLDGDGILDVNDNCMTFPALNNEDSDGDNIGDACDNCPELYNPEGYPDADGDGIGDACDSCPDDPDNDEDADGICGDVDNCPTACNTNQSDFDGDGVGNACDICLLGDDSLDGDGDGVPDACDICSGGDDSLDGDGDGAPDACDICSGGDDNLDADVDGVPDACDICPGNNDSVDGDGDGVPDGCDICPGGDDHGVDADNDGVPDLCDLCASGNDNVDNNGNGTPDACDPCPLGTPDTDGDGICDENDVCPADNPDDSDGDGICDSNDPCPADNPNDTDGDGVCDSSDICPAGDDNVDADADGVPDACDACPGKNDAIDSDGDGVPDACDDCPNDPENDVDGDGICGDADNCPDVSNFDQIDVEGDGVGDACDPSPGYYASPTLSISSPSGGFTVEVGSLVAITYSLEDVDDVVTATFYPYTDAGGLSDTALTGDCASAGEGADVSCTWSTVAFEPGTYYIYGVVNDGLNPEVTAYSGSITLTPHCVGDRLVNYPYANSGEPGINGSTPQTAYSICTLSQLAASGGSRTNGKYLILKTDIDASSKSSGQGWWPIMTLGGTFDGNGHTVSNLYINRPTQSAVGLFASTHESLGGVIKNLGLLNVNITGGDASGGLIGYSNYLTISNCYVTGSVTGTQSVGGLVGKTTYGKISKSSSDAAVNATSYSGNSSSGGLIGYVSAVTISDCYAKGSVSGNNGSLGGLIGQGNYLTSILRSYADVDVTGHYDEVNAQGNTRAGGLLSKGVVTMRESFAAGNVTGESPLASGAAALSVDNPNPRSNLWYNSEAVVLNNGAGGVGNPALAATGDFEVNLQDKTHNVYSAWDFVNVWQENPGAFPTLRFADPPAENNETRIVAFTSASQSGVEADGTFTVTAEILSVSSLDVTIPFTLSGTATEGSDYTITASPVIIHAGETTADIIITMNDDGVEEPDETVIVTMGTPTNAVKDSLARYIATIIDNDGTPTVSFAAASQIWPENKLGTITVTAEISVISNLDATIPFTIGGTATQGAGEDYTITASPIIIPAGEASADITIDVNDDSAYEPNETIIVTMGTPTNAILGLITEHTATISDNEPAPTVAFTTTSQSGSEAVGTFTLTAEISEAMLFDVTVPFTLGGTATEGAGEDYTITASPITIPAGETTADIVIVVDDDNVYELDETIIVSMGVPDNAVRGAIAEYTATISNDDPPPTATFTTASQSGAEAVGTFTVTAEISFLSIDVTIPFTLSGTATEGVGEDYTITPSPITIPRGETTADITIAVNDDGGFEPEETIIITMGTPTNASLGAIAEHTATIEGFPTVEFTAPSQNGGEAVGAFTITAEISQVWGFDVTVPFTYDGTATEGVDYAITASPIVIPAGSTTAAVVIAVNNDGQAEGDETVTVTMGTPTNAALGAITEHTATITANDGTQTVSFTSASQSGWEAVGTFTLTVELSAISEFDVTIPFTLGGTATEGAGADYTITPSPIIIPAGSTTAEVVITVNDDLAEEIDESVTVTMGTPVNATMGAIAEHTATIKANDYCNTGNRMDNSPFANSGEPGIDGLTIENAYAICTLAQLNEVRTELDKKFILKNDIDAADTASGAGTMPWNTASGWEPIGTAAAAFTGEFDGGGLAISNLFINRPNLWSDGVGLFGRSEGTERNINLLNVDILGIRYVGALVGNALYGTISNSSSTGIIEAAPDCNNGAKVGGLIGFHGYGTISNSNSDVTISGENCSTLSINNYAGGLVGYASNSTISNCYSNGNISGNHSSFGGLAGMALVTNISTSHASGNMTGNRCSGGLLGEGGNTTEITNSYAVGNIAGLRAGGLVGYHYYGSMTVNNSYAVGNVVGTVNSGGLIGYSKTPHTVSNSFSTGDVSGNTSVDYQIGPVVGALDGAAFGPGSGIFYNSGAVVVNAGAGLLTDHSAFATGDSEENLKDRTHAVYGAWDFFSVWQENPGDFPTLKDEFTETRLVSFGVASQSVTEAVGTFPITVKISSASSLDVTVPFTLGGTATEGAGADYTITASPITIPAGSTTSDIVVTVNDDALDDDDETIIVTMGTPTNAFQGPITDYTATVADNDAPVLVTFTPTAAVGAEDIGTFTLTAELSSIYSLDITVPFALSGTATEGAGADYTITASPIIIPAGSTTAGIVITVNDDALDEGDETVIVTMGTPTNAAQGAITEYTAIISDNDGVLPANTVDNGDGTWTTTLQPGPTEGKDTYVAYHDDNVGENTNYGTSVGMITRYYSGQYQVESYLEFDLSALPINQVTNSTLSLYFYTGNWGATRYVAVGRITSPWDELTVTGLYAPTRDGTNYDNQNIPANTFKFYDWNVTGIVQGWKAGTWPNYGFVLRLTTGSIWTYGYWYTSDYTVDPTLRPKLSITYTPVY